MKNIVKLSRKQCRRLLSPLCAIVLSAALVFVFVSCSDVGSTTTDDTPTACGTITYTVSLNGDTDTTAINLTFSAAVSYLYTSDITITNGTRSVTEGTLTGSGQNWSLGITVATAGNVTVNITNCSITAIISQHDVTLLNTS